MENAYILGIDQGTSGTKAILFDSGGRMVHRCNAGHAQTYPQPGWVEHDALEIHQRTLEAARSLIAESGIDPAAVRAVSISNQRETAVVWDGRSGIPAHNAVVWQCRRGAAICERLEKAGAAEEVGRKTGLVLSPYFSAAKIAWILENVEGARERADRGELRCGTIDSWLVWKLSGGAVHATDYSNASRTQLFDIRALRWDDGLLGLFGIPPSMMAEVRPSDARFGETDLGGLLPSPVPMTGVMGDSHAALFGQCCFRPGMAKATYGTGSSIMMNVGGVPVESRSGLVSSIAWARGGAVEYVLEGNVNCTGATIKWLVDDLELIPDSKSAGPIAASVPDNQGVYLVPAFVGLSAPYWDSEARASVTGMSRGTRKAHLVRAAEESIAYQIRDVLDAMAAESGAPLAELRVDGGPTRDDFLMRFQADILGIPVVRAVIEELSSIGASYMAGLAIGFWKDAAEIEGLRAVDRAFAPGMDEETRSRNYGGWKGAVGRTLTARRP
jgi:glycerol kinase